MKKAKKPTMTWEEAPDIIGVNELMAISGLGKNYVSNIFKSKGFPKISDVGTSLKADKEAARIFLQGVKIKENSKSSIEYLILLQLKKITEQLEKLSEDETLSYKEEK